ncbi:MAG: VIT domain-containing protein, partial [Polaribacter sp.]
KKLNVKRVAISVSIIGDIAITNFDMQFYNPNNRVLEGELSFPLGENQSVNRFALDINGKLREAVVVEKEKARVAYESTVRNRIDPALLEKTKGNNYKARVYPIPAKGYKRVVVDFQQKLLLSNGAYYYKLPLRFKKKLDFFSFDMEIFNQKIKPISEKGVASKFMYDKKKDAYYMKIDKKKSRITQPIFIKIPLNPKKEKMIVNDNFFYLSKQLDIETSKIALEKEITLFWDVSFSQRNKKIHTELAFLETYFKKVKNATIKLVTFNTEIREENNFIIKSGNWNALKNTLNNVVYDGASSFESIAKYTSQTKLNLLFTDGLSTLSNTSLKFNTKTHIINSTISANHIVLKNAANYSGGNYVNLQQTSISDVFKKITKPQLQFLGTNLPEHILETYPKKGEAITNNFTLSAKGSFYQKNIKIYMGVGNDTLKTIKLNSNNNKTVNNHISKIWAQKKLDFLTINSKINENKIIEISKKHQIISPFTSMLILDRIEDYVTHNIEPPKELKEQFFAIKSKRTNNKKERIAKLQKELFNKYEAYFSWYDKNYVFKKKITNVIKKSVDTIERRVTETNQNIQNTSRNGSENEFLISGIVKDVSDPLPGVSISVQGKSRGTQTDFDGKYSIRVLSGEVLKFSYLGYNTVAKTINSNRIVNVTLEEDDSVLEEIVVTGYARGTTTRAVTSSVTVVSSQIVTSALRGKVSGVTIKGISDNKENFYSKKTNLKNKPLYIVDGVLVKNPDVNPKKLHSIYVLKSEQGETIYGSRGKNGVVVIVTKKGNEDDLDEIADFEELVSEKLELKGWNPKTPYLKVLEQTTNTKEAYLKYIELRSKYENSPSFYIDVADFFINKKETSIAYQILTNVAEIDLDNFELLKALAYKFEEYKLYKYAVYIYKEVVELRPEDIQSHRDLALSYEQIGAYQKSLDLLYEIVNGELLVKDENRRFEGIEVIALNELNRMITLYGNQLNINHIDKKYIKNIQTDVRVLIDWNHNDTDIDLWVTDPNNEKCYYSHKKTKIGGLISDDMTEGFGPEQFVLKKGLKGEYVINVDYYASDAQKISGPTFLKVTTFKNYGSKNEIKKVKLVRLKSIKEELKVGKLIF